MAFDVTQVDALNQKIQRLNSERQRAIGLQQAATQAYDKSVYAYGQKWGVQVDDTNIQQEYNAVHEELVSQFNSVNKLVQDIESGVYQPQVTPTLVENNTSIAQQAQQQQAQQAFVQPTVAQQAMQQVPQQQQTFQQTPQQEFEHRQVPTDLQAQAAMSAMTQQVPVTPQQGTFGQVSTPSTPSTPTMPNPSQTGQQALDPSEQSFTPEGWGGQSTNINTTFSDINNGKPFGQ